MKNLNELVHGYGEITKFAIEHDIGYRRVQRMLQEGNYYRHEGAIYKRVAKLNENNRHEETKNRQDSIHN